MSKKMAVKTQSAKTQKRFNFAGVKLPAKLLRVTFACLLFVSSGVLVWKFLTIWSSILPVDKIALVGKTEHVTQKEIAEILATNEFSGMLSIDMSLLREQLLKMPWVRDVQVRKIWPDTLSFEIKEFQPIAIINQRYLTEKGSLIEESNYIAKSTVLKITIENDLSSVDINFVSLVKQLGEIQTKLANNGMEMKSLNISKSDNWIINLQGKFFIKVGRKQQLQRIENFLKVYAAIEDKNKLESVDLRYSNGFAVKLINDAIALKQNG